MTKIINGRKFDISNERVLSYKDKSYYMRFNKFKPYQIRPFIDYLLSGIILEWEWNSRGGYNTLKYDNSRGEHKELSGNHGLTEILKGIENGRWNPSEVLHDFIVFYRGCSFCDDSTKEERMKLYNEVKDLIKLGYSVKFN